MQQGHSSVLRVALPIFVAAVFGGFLFSFHLAHADYSISDGSVMALYHLEDTNDSSGNGYNLMNNSSTTFTTGKLGSYAADGGSTNTSKSLSIGNNLGVTGDVSFSCWGKFTGTAVNNTQYTLMRLDNADNSVQYQLLAWYNSGTEQMAAFRANDLVAGAYANSNFTFDDNAWHYYVLTYNGSTVTLYIDGSSTATVSQTGTGHGGGDNFNLLNDDGTQYWKGIVDECAVFNRVLTGTEITALYDGGTGQQISVAPESYYAQIENASTLNLRDGSSTSADILKTLPAGWIIQVMSSTDQSGNPMVNSDGHWFKVMDPTDGVTGWMEASSTGAQYISSYDGSMQAAMEASSSLATTGYVATSSRPYVVGQAIDNYYNNSSMVNSLYSSDDDTGINAATTTPPGRNSPNDLSIFDENSYPEKLIFGIAAAEDGPNFDNQIVTRDYGHGVMQVTPNILIYEQEDGNDYSSTKDPRGYGSGITIIPCASYMTSTYTNCYADSGSGDGTDKHPYIPYGDNVGSSTYLQYTNTPQSIYANIKDGMKVLEDKLDDNLVCDATTTSITIDGLTYSCTDREIVLATAGYNGTSSYLTSVASDTFNIDNFFPNQTSSDMTDIINKLFLAASSTVYVQLESPGDLSVTDSQGRTIGVVNGIVKDDFPFASYDSETKSVHIFFPQDDNFTYKVVGTGSGPYRLHVSITNGTQQIDFQSANITISPGEIHTFMIDKNMILNNQPGVTLKIDRKGNGTVDEVDTFNATVRTLPSVKLIPEPFPPIPRQTKFDFSIPLSPKVYKSNTVYIPQMPTSTFDVSTSSIIVSSTLEMHNASSTRINSSTQNL